MAKTLVRIVVLFFLLFPDLAISQVEEPASPPEEDSYLQLPHFPEELALLKPSEVLSNGKLSDEEVMITDQIDTFDIHCKFLFEGVDSTRFFMFSLKENPNTHFKMAVKRDDSWVVFNASLLKRLTLDGSHFSIVKFKGSTDEILNVVVSTPEDKQVNSKFGGGVESQWKYVSIVTLINLSTFEIYLNNLYVGYDYRFSEKQREGDALLKTTKSARLEYDVTLNERKRRLTITEATNSLRTSIKRGEGEEVLTEEIKNKCAPIQFVGDYFLEGNKFILKK
jgi:hypothetical protein